MNKVNESQRLMVNEQGDWQYPSAAESGYVEVELPALPGSLNPTERLHARDFGPLVVEKIESSMQRGYLKSGPQQGPAQVFRHYTVVAKGAGLMDEGALKRMEQLAEELAAEPEQGEFFAQVVRPWLHSLKPGRR